MQKDYSKNEKRKSEICKPLIIPVHQRDHSAHTSSAGSQKVDRVCSSLKPQLHIPSSKDSSLSKSSPEQYSTSVSATGGTIHHHGRTPSKSPFAQLSRKPISIGPCVGQDQEIGQQSASNSAVTFSTKVTHSPSLGTMSGVAEGSNAPQTQVKNGTGPSPSKKIKIEDISTVSPEVAALRKCIVDHMIKEKSEIKENYIEHLTELFFLKNGWNMVDYPSWKKRPTPQLVQYLKSASLDSEDEEEPSPEKKSKILTTLPSVPPITPVATATTLPAPVAALAQQGQGSSLNLPVATGAQTASTLTPPVLSTSTASVVTSVTSVTTSSAPKTIATPLLAKAVSELKPGTPSLKSSTSQSGHRNIKSLSSGGLKAHVTRQTITFPENGGLSSQEAIVERAKQEAQVMQRVAELRKDGLWTSAKLPKVQEPSRQKAHWDYLLEEMQWLATDFIQERKWKKAAARKVAKMVAKYHQELEQKEIKAEKEEGLKLKKIASQMAKQVKEFWSNIEKVVQYKQQSRMEEKRKKALDLHLNFIVDQTEKYSTWLTESLAAGSTHGSESKHSTPEHSIVGDGEFQPEGDESDDEETIQKAEEEIGMDEEETRKEIEELQKESELPIEELLKTLPAEILDKPASIHSSDEEVDLNKSTSEDQEFTVENEDEADVEDTIAEEEKLEKHDYSNELLDLEQEGEMSLEELAKKYAGAYDSDFEFPDSETDAETDEEEAAEESQDESVDEEDDEMEVDEEKTDEVGLEFLMNQEKTADNEAETSEQVEEEGPGKEITDIAAEAQRLQPKGYTLETTEVHTTVPFLLKHTLREYQHVGLDWLATMYTKKLNGILADEMGLGKTIQTIALLAHLACEKGIWGPHLIVVPTSVMLNWELEFKKWCPAFKILTYYGTQKERKLKRTGWTKTNAFHVCITSYKLVIQDHQSFRRKKWKYFILDEAQNIKNFKSQRWQTLLNFQSQRRLLLTGTPLQNSLMELWSLMHFLMPHVFQSHREFKEWFANPLTGMVEGSFEYNESLIKRLHKVLRPFLLRRLKKDVEQQMPKKYEHVVMCKLSKRQRFLYDDFMAQGKTKETLAGGHFMSVINILMQLRKVCNHPNLFDPRPIVSPFQMEGITYSTASLVLKSSQRDPLKEIDIHSLFPSLVDMEKDLPAFVAHRVKNLQTSRKLIEEIHSGPEPPPRSKKMKLKKLVVRSASPLLQNGTSSLASITSRSASPVTLVKPSVSRESTPTSSLSVLPTPIKLGIVSQPQSVTATPPSASSLIISSSSSSGVSPATIQAKVLPSSFQGGATTLSSGQQIASSQPITLQIQQTEQGTRFMIPTGQLNQLPGLIQIVQTSSGQQVISSQTNQIHPVISTQNTSSILLVNGPPPITTIAGTTQGTVNVVSVTSSTKTTPVVQLPSGTSVSSGMKPIMRVSPLAAAGQSQVTSSNDSATTNVKTAECKKSTEVPNNHQGRLADVSTVSTLSTRSSASRELIVRKKSKLFLESLDVKRNSRLSDKLTFLSELNSRHCETKPVYGQDLCNTVSVLNRIEKTKFHYRWRGEGLINCNCVHICEKATSPEYYWYKTRTLSEIIHTPEQYLEELKDILNRYIFHTPPVRAPPIQMHVFHPPPTYLVNETQRELILKKEISPRAACFHNINTNMSVQFPELRLIQYDCGKLQTLDILLRQLKSDSHRVLIFTQMTRMLDVLEAFLNFHGHRYLRLDGTTRVEQRQFLMDKFNADRRIFCFILSTRSGGIGVNLTGADTVIFYDSDWNPTMDAQAQDRCHRIGQTKDVHIYRLISEKTVEENILKKANQKRMLGDMAIEGGNFTTAFFKENTIKELFDEPSGLEALAKMKEKENEPKVKEVVSDNGTGEPRRTGSPATIMNQYEQALCKAEDETDVIAANLVKAEQKAELAEFDENIPWDEKEAENKKETEEVSKLELELAMLEKELSPIERYAVNYMETIMEPETAEELALAEEDIEDSKKEWELSRLMALKQEEERRAEIEEDEMLYTYTREDSAQVKKKKEKANKKARNSLEKPKRNKASPQKSEIVANDTSSTPTDEFGLSQLDKIVNEVKLQIKLNSALAENTKNKASRRKSDPECKPKGRKKSVKSETSDQTETPSKDKKVKRRSTPGAKVSKSKSPKSDSNGPILSVPDMKQTPKAKPPTSVPLHPWSNPNLVIRTRKAAKKEQDGDEIDVVSYSSDNNISRPSAPLTLSSHVQHQLNKAILSTSNQFTARSNPLLTMTNRLQITPQSVAHSTPSHSQAHRLPTSNIQIPSNFVQMARGNIQATLNSLKQTPTPNNHQIFSNLIGSPPSSLSHLQFVRDSSGNLVDIRGNIPNFVNTSGSPNAPSIRISQPIQQARLVQPNSQIVSRPSVSAPPSVCQILANAQKANLPSTSVVSQNNLITPTNINVVSQSNVGNTPVMQASPVVLQRKDSGNLIQGQPLIIQNRDGKLLSGAPIIIQRKDGTFLSNSPVVIQRVAALQPVRIQPQQVTTNIPVVNHQNYQVVQGLSTANTIVTPQMNTLNNSNVQIAPQVNTLSNSNVHVTPQVNTLNNSNVQVIQAAVAPTPVVSGQSVQNIIDTAQGLQIIQPQLTPNPSPQKVVTLSNIPQPIVDGNVHILPNTSTSAKFRENLFEKFGSL